MVKTHSPSLQAQALLELRRRGVTGKEDKPLWQPNPDRDDGTPNPQLLALKSDADEIFFGGSAGGGKSDLLLGAAFTEHTKSVIFRRVNPLLKDLIRRSIEIVGSDDCFNKTEKMWDVNGRVVEFGAMQYEEDKKNWQGRPHSLIAFDEVTEFTRTQYLYPIAWNRSTKPGERCRVIAAGNPPIDEAGSWVITEWGPWLDDEFPDPAEPGELRWFYYNDDDRIVWLKSGEPVEVNGEIYYPRSRTFIPSKLSDNPYHSRDTKYLSVLQSLPAEMKPAFLHGDFKAKKASNPWQVIPTDWVRLAQKRWMEREKPDTPLIAVGIDAARGGRDAMTIAKRYDNWFAEVDKIPGVNVEDGPALATITWQRLGDEKPLDYMNIDAIGIGSSGYDSLKVMYNNVVPVYAGDGSDYRDKSGALKMRNVRAEYYWQMREALDPEHGDDLAMPPGNEIVADLCAARYKATAAGITIEEKEEIKKRIGRSPDVGEAILLALYSSGSGGVFIANVGA